MADEVPRAPLLLFVVGPPAVGKMTVGAAIAQRTGLRLFHNHQTIDLVLRFFPFVTPPFQRLVVEFRRRILEELAGSGQPGVIFTFVRAFDQASDDAIVEESAQIFRDRGGRVLFLELEASQHVRLLRNEHELRLAEKAVMRDIAEERARLLELEEKYELNSGVRFDGWPDYLKIDNTDLSADEVAERVIEAFEITTD
jgi:shikimate kinase